MAYSLETKLVKYITPQCQNCGKYKLDCVFCYSCGEVNCALCVDVYECNHRVCHPCYDHPHNKDAKHCNICQLNAGPVTPVQRKPSFVDLAKETGPAFHENIKKLYQAILANETPTCN